MHSVVEKVKSKKTARPRVVKIGGVRVSLRSNPSKGKIPVQRLKTAVAEVVACRKG
jgi:hypothetical protein